MRVPLQVVFRNLDRSDAVVARIKERAAWLERFSDRIISCRVAVEAPHRRHHTGNLFHIRVDVRVPGREIVVSRKPDLHGAHKDLLVTLHDAFDEVRRKLEDNRRTRRGEVKRLESPPHAIVARLLPEEAGGGSGFLRTEDGRDLYFHSNSVLRRQYAQLEVGTVVRFAEEMGDDGPQASTVEIVGRKASRKRAA